MNQPPGQYSPWTAGIRVAPAWMLTVLFLALGACQPEERVVRSTWDDLARQGSASGWSVNQDPSATPGPGGIPSNWTGDSGDKLAPNDLRRYIGNYSLQVAAFNSAFGPNYKQAAEKMAADLRGKGEQAFFYHGPTHSMVTLGIFNSRDVVIEDNFWTYGPRILTLQAKFPQNLVNGKAFMEQPDPNTPAKPQPSFLVEVK